MGFVMLKFNCQLDPTQNHERRASQWGWSVGMSVGGLSYVDRCGKTQQPTEHPDLHESGWIKLGTSEHARTFLCSSLATWSSYLGFAVTTELQPGSIHCSKPLLPLNCFLSECFVSAPEMKLGQTEWNGRWVYLLPGKDPLRTKVRIYSCRYNEGPRNKTIQDNSRPKSSDRCH